MSIDTHFENRVSIRDPPNTAKNLHGTCFEGKINWLGPKNSAKRRAPDLENQESG
jgi:hypothetical protein